MISKDTARHYSWGQNCDGLHLVESDGPSVIRERMPVGTSEVRHFHHKSRQFFFVLSGEVTLEIAGTRDVLGQYEGAEVSPGVPHQIFNNSEAEVEFLVISQPSTHGDRFPLVQSI